MATFYTYLDRVAPAQNKYMLTLFNTSTTRKVTITKVIWLPNSVSAVTGVAHDMYLARITARTAGTTVNIRSRDSADTLSTGIAADTGSTSVTEGYVMQRFVGATEELIPTSLAAYFGTLNGPGAVLYVRLPGTTGETLRENEGITIRTNTNSAVGTMSFLIEFMDEPA